MKAGSTSNFPMLNPFNKLATDTRRHEGGPGSFAPLQTIVTA